MHRIDPVESLEIRLQSHLQRYEILHGPLTKDEGFKEERNLLQCFQRLHHPISLYSSMIANSFHRGKLERNLSLQGWKTNLLFFATLSERCFSLALLHGQHCDGEITLSSTSRLNISSCEEPLRLNTIQEPSEKKIAELTLIAATFAIPSLINLIEKYPPLEELSPIPNLTSLMALQRKEGGIKAFLSLASLTDHHRKIFLNEIEPRRVDRAMERVVLNLAFDEHPLSEWNYNSLASISKAMRKALPHHITPPLQPFFASKRALDFLLHPTRNDADETFSSLSKREIEPIALTVLQWGNEPHRRILEDLLIDSMTKENYSFLQEIAADCGMDKLRLAAPKKELKSIWNSIKNDQTIDLWNQDRDLLEATFELLENNEDRSLFARVIVTALVREKRELLRRLELHYDLPLLRERLESMNRNGSSFQPKGLQTPFTKTPFQLLIGFVAQTTRGFKELVTQKIIHPVTREKKTLHRRWYEREAHLILSRWQDDRIELVNTIHLDVLMDLLMIIPPEDVAFRQAIDRLLCEQFDALDHPALQTTILQDGITPFLDRWHDRKKKPPQRSLIANLIYPVDRVKALPRSTSLTVAERLSQIAMIQGYELSPFAQQLIHHHGDTPFLSNSDGLIDSFIDFYRKGQLSHQDFCSLIALADIDSDFRVKTNERQVHLLHEHELLWQGSIIEALFRYPWLKESFLALEVEDQESGFTFLDRLDKLEFFIDAKERSFLEKGSSFLEKDGKSLYPVAPLVESILAQEPLQPLIENIIAILPTLSFFLDESHDWRMMKERAVDFWNIVGPTPFPIAPYRQLAFLGIELPNHVGVFLDLLTTYRPRWLYNLALLADSYEWRCDGRLLEEAQKLAVRLRLPPLRIASQERIRELITSLLQDLKKIADKNSLTRHERSLLLLFTLSYMGHPSSS